MSEQKTFTLPKKERLCRKTLIDHLFMGHSNSKKEWPIRAVYQVVERKDDLEAPVEMLVSVSKRFFKRAVKRNLVKRQLRESFRVHQAILTDKLNAHPDAKLLVAFIWMSNHVCASQEVEASMIRVLNKMLGDLVFEEVQTAEP